jgi:hypothetical protein
MANIIITNTSHRNDSSIETVISNRAKSNGYYGSKYGLHTVQYNLLDFIGNIKFQGTLELSPTESDWFDIETSYVESHDNLTENIIKNYIGNFVYSRCVIQYTHGTIRSVLFTSLVDGSIETDIV